VHQPVGPDTELAVKLPLFWSPGRTLQASAIASDGTVFGPAKGEIRNDHFVFRYAGELDGHTIAAYRLHLD
jgi:hypothetical protein